MNALEQRTPVSGVKERAIAEALGGIATIDLNSEKVEFIPGHNETALASARAKYGSEFVDWVVAREPAITRILSQ